VGGVLLARFPARTVTARGWETSFRPDKEAVAMERMMTAYWDEDREELEVRRPTGQVFRFSARQAVAGGHEVFGVQVIDNEILVLTGASGSRRPTWKVRYTQTGTYRGTSALGPGGGAATSREGGQGTALVAFG